MRALCGDLEIPPEGSITFISGRLPYGFAFPESPATHLFKYPDLGIAIIDGLAAEQPETRGTNVAVLVDPETDASDIEVAKERLPPRGMFVRGYRGPAANVRDVASMIELYPFDLLIIAAHCGDAAGYRSTYRWTDSEGIERELVVDEALGIGRPDKDDLLKVTKFSVFRSLDGVDWNDPLESEKLYVGSAILDFGRRGGLREDFLPKEQITIERVVGSAALKMSDSIYIAEPRALACEGTPIIINNACTSWHRLAETFTFANARAYVGTLFPVLSIEAVELMEQLLGKHFGKPLAVAVWLAQRKFSDGRRPYVVTGVYPQRLRSSRENVPARIAKAMSSGLARRRRSLQRPETLSDVAEKVLKDEIEYYERELTSHKKRWKIR